MGKEKWVLYPISNNKNELKCAPILCLKVSPCIAPNASREQ